VLIRHKIAKNDNKNFTKKREKKAKKCVSEYREKQKE